MKTANKSVPFYHLDNCDILNQDTPIHLIECSNFPGNSIDWDRFKAVQVSFCKLLLKTYFL